MSVFRPCSICEQKVPGKLASLYAAWFRADGTRVASKQRLCVGCLQAGYVELLRKVADESNDTDTCPSCGSSNTDDLDPIYLTLYLPKQPEREFELGMDSACAAKLRLVLQQGCEPLQDRTASGRGPSPSPSAWDSVL